MNRLKEDLKDLAESTPSENKQVLNAKMGFSVKVANDEIEDTRSHNWVHYVLADARFDAIIGVVIIANSATIGVEQTFRLLNNRPVLDMCQYLEYTFLFIYTVELGLRFYASGLACLHSAWVKFDFILVMLGLVTTFIVEPIVKYSATAGENAGSILGPVMVLRVLRLARLARALRLLAQFKELWMLVP